MKIIQIIPVTEKVYSKSLRGDVSYKEYLTIYGLGDDGVMYEKVSRSKKDIWKKVITSEDVK